jgi:NADH-quinone oxidoreductase subunit E
MLSPEEKQEIDHEIAILRQKKSACIEALKAVQRHRRWVTDDAVRDVAEYLEMSVDEVDNVATFYNLIYRKPVGRHVIHICDSVSCWVVGYRPLLAALEEHLKIGLGETTTDDRFTLLPIPCLGTCDHAPAMMVDRDLHRDIDPARVAEILERYE